MAKKMLATILSSTAIFLQSCSIGVNSNHIEQDCYEYSKYDLSYEGIVYTGICQNCTEDKQQPQYIVHEIPQIKAFCTLYGIDSLLSNFEEWYYYATIDSSTCWQMSESSVDIVSWGSNAETYIIYLAITNGYKVMRDCESGYLYFRK